MFALLNLSEVIRANFAVSSVPSFWGKLLGTAANKYIAKNHVRHINILTVYYFMLLLEVIN